MLLHSCDLEILQRGVAIEALDHARREGKIRFAGYSGDNAAALFAAERAEFQVIETSINLCDQANISGLLPLALKKGLGVLAKRPIANTAWRSPEHLPGLYREYARTYAERFQAMGLKATDLGFSSEENWPEIALRFTLSQPGVSSAIIGTTKKSNAERNIKAAVAGPLPRTTLEKIHAAFQRAEKESGHSWEGQR
jgi:aryl-alcohol dehydrogenase-like predicted oxidoreductase